MATLRLTSFCSLRFISRTLLLRRISASSELGTPVYFIFIPGEKMTRNGRNVSPNGGTAPPWCTAAEWRGGTGAGEDRVGRALLCDDAVPFPRGRVGFWLDLLVAGREGEDCLPLRGSAWKGKLSSPETLIPKFLLWSSLLSPSATPAWRRLPPLSEWCFPSQASAQDPGPLCPLLLSCDSSSLGGLPVVGRKELLHRQGFSCRNSTGNLNIGLNNQV